MEDDAIPAATLVVMRDRHKVAEITNTASVTTDTVLETIANTEVRAS